ncbi:MAG TPA: acyl-CoA thioesterase [Spirochaetota bacterium]|jgi:acyl-CoA hydrolase|nr:acyl-CoA thioesterase [Spirochaetota bacterium]HOF02264.1 acyl-CoA thioesterase [Spirochaetota bacterium]HOS34079.1 acyl-CoA thioesterase [Spirochaetota bacterium]HOS56657.1 acyl-CoA thioesterase [Spirochaetota bacterium]HPY87362.1 acyl-CoA thioesterase [Spirochaetota bacterium]
MISKHPKDSSVETRNIVMPEHANHYGTVFGGVIMSWIDIAAAMAAERHCGHEAVTVSIDTISFRLPINIGDHVVLKASVNFVGTTSMEIGVQVTKENPITGESGVSTTAYLTFVGLGKDKKPVKIPDLIPETEDERRRFKNAEIRVAARKKLLKQIKLKS